MYIVADSLDDVLQKIFPRLLRSTTQIKPTKGEAREIAGAVIKLRNPRIRLSRTDNRGVLFSCLGEWLWYMSGTNSLKFISYYVKKYAEFSDDNKTIHGGYGPRLFGEGKHDQIHRIIELLQRKQDSRQAVVQIFDSSDILVDHKDVPCTCTLQFMVRNRRLNLIASMRSNDAYLGLPHDFFAFTMLQELIARSLDLELGYYKHFVGSLHLYKTDEKKATQYLTEGWQQKVAMPPMPYGNPWPSMKKVLKFESSLRNGGQADLDHSGLDPYWIDILRLLEIFSLTKFTKEETHRSLVSKLRSDVYAPYLRKHLEKGLNQSAQLIIPSI